MKSRFLQLIYVVGLVHTRISRCSTLQVQLIDRDDPIMLERLEGALSSGRFAPLGGAGGKEDSGTPGRLVDIGCIL